MEIIVKTNCPKNEVVSLNNGIYKINIKAKPEKGKANKEIEKFLSKYFKRKVRIISGFKSRKKLLDFEI